MSLLLFRRENCLRHWGSKDFERGSKKQLRRRTMPTTPGTGAQLPTTTTRTTATLSCRSSRATSGEHVTLDEVFDAYYDCRCHKRSKRSAVKYELDYELRNYQLWKELNDMTYRPTTSIAFCVTVPKLREVFAADFRDRVVHHLLISRISHVVESRLTDAACACRVGKGSLYGANRLRNMMNGASDCWYARCDIQGFFMSIDKDVLMGIVDGVVREACPTDTDWWLWLAETVIMHRPEHDCELHGNTRLWDKLPANKTLFKTNGRGLPIGNLTSQVLANLYMAEFDKWITERLGGEMRYIRYVDDFVIIHEDKDYLLKVLGMAVEWLKENRGLTVHPKKTCIQRVRHGISFVGYFIKGGVIHSGRRTRANALAVAREWGRHSEHTSDERIKLRGRYNSYSGILKHTASWKIRRKMWRLLGDYKGITNINMNKIKIK